MPYNIIFNTEYSVIESELYGVVRVDDLLRMFEDMVDYSLKCKSYLWLHNFFRAKRDINLGEVFFIPRQLDVILKRLGPDKQHIRRAIVTNIDVSDFKFAEMVSGNIGHKMKIFEDVDSARSWLKALD